MDEKRPGCGRLGEGDCMSLGASPWLPSGWLPMRCMAKTDGLGPGGSTPMLPLPVRWLRSSGEYPPPPLPLGGPIPDGSCPSMLAWRCMPRSACSNGVSTLPTV